MVAEAPREKRIAGLSSARQSVEQKTRRISTSRFMDGYSVKGRRGWILKESRVP
jgi:hypothetical protein